MSSVSSTQPANLPDGTSRRKVLLFDLDGVRPDKLRAARTPNLDALAAVGRFGLAWTHDLDAAPTVSGPGHSNVLTGVWPDKHQVRDNNIVPNALADFPDFLTRLRSVRPELSTFAVGDWPPLIEQIIATPHAKALFPYEDNGSAESGRLVLEWARVALAEHNPDVAYVYFVHVDSAGHSFGGASPEYISAIEEVDRAVGVLLETVRTRPTYDDEEWLFVATTDHGHTDVGGHGGSEPEVRQIWTLAAGGGLGVGPSQASMVDVVPTVLAHLGVEVDPAWKLDGTPIEPT